LPTVFSLNIDRESVCG